MVTTEKKTGLRMNSDFSRDDVPQMFDRISRRYDLLNHLLSFGCDFHWRRQAVRELGNSSNQLVLDLATGTGDLALAAVKADADRKIVGVDMAGQMLSLAAAKIDKCRLSDRVGLVRGNGIMLPLAKGSVDAAMIAFGIRNMPDTSLCLDEFRRVIRSGGRLVVLEFSLPSNPVMRAAYLTYFRYILPILGRLVSGDSFAYRYLNGTVESYVRGEKFLALMRQAGFANVRQRQLTFGVVTIYTGESS